MESTTMESRLVYQQDHLQAQAMEKLHGAAALEAYLEHPNAGEQVVLLW